MTANYQFSRPQSPLRDAVTNAYRLEEATAVAQLLPIAAMDEATRKQTDALARRLVEKVRADRSRASGVDALMHEFSLSSDEGLALMCLAEALLRIPDNATRNKLIQDKISGGDWKSHLHKSPSLFVNAAAWGLLVTGKLTGATDEKTLSMALTRALGKGGEPMIRGGVNYAMRLLGKQFVTGQTIKEALKNGKEREKRGYLFSFDMLGEAAMTQADADRYFQEYLDAIHAIGKDAKGKDPDHSNGISVKLSAIHPRYWRAQRERVMAELLPRLRQLFHLAKHYNIGLNVDAEEASRLELSLDLMDEIIADPQLQGFNGIGFVVQAYQKRCPYVIDYLIDKARAHNQRLMIRLVKGAYWDSEIKWAQVDGIDGYPVYTQKVHTDVSYLACARKLLAAPDVIFPQFATHNAYSLAAIHTFAGDAPYEFQCLHGMGETLYDQVVGKDNLNRVCRIYAPVGTHQTLLAYLVRRLLENGANSSFVNKIVDENVSIDELVENPLDLAETTGGRQHPLIPLASGIYGETRRNSTGLDFNNEHLLMWLEQNMNLAAQRSYYATSLTNTALPAHPAHPVLNPSDSRETIGHAVFADPAGVHAAMDDAIAAQPAWAALTAADRSARLRYFADLLEINMAEFIHLAVREAGKTLLNAIAEIREAVDFCRYYAHEAETTLAGKPALGVIVAISPWNFPLAIFTGEVISALAAGNSVVCKPAEQTSLIAHRAVELMLEAGIPLGAVQLVLGAGDVGAALVADPRIAGVIFTGSTAVAQRINRLLAERENSPVLIAETGGQNAMIVDSTALPEQVCVDVLGSAFDSAGQRCSALRILCLQEDIADHLLEMLKGAMDELRVGNPCYLSTDIGPVIDHEAKANLDAHIEKMRRIARQQYACSLPEGSEQGTFVAPILLELDNLDQLEKEVFGPVLHVIRFKGDQLDALIAQINRKGYALTHGIHSRIDRTIDHICQRIEAGNVYVNRNIVGAVVGVQPFGGHGLSGTGPKAGGPFYLQRLAQVDYWQIPKLSQKGQADETALETVQQALVNLPLEGNLSDALLRAQDHTLCEAEVRLPGPTGERNLLYWHPPQRVRLYGGDLNAAARTLLILAGSGIVAEVDENHPLATHQGTLRNAIRVVAHAEDDNAFWVLLEPLPIETKIALAERDGPIVHLINGQHGLDIRRLFAEVCLSVNTTAAGGNASLMAQV